MGAPPMLSLPPKNKNKNSGMGAPPMARRVHFSGPAILFLYLLLTPALAQQPRFSKPLAPSSADQLKHSPPELQDIGVDEHRGAQIPLDLTFTNEAGQTVPLRQYFDGRRPVVLQLGYFECPMLCGLVSKGVAESLKQLDLAVGKDFQFLYVSIDPAETAELAGKKRQSYLNAIGQPHDPAAFHLLVGQEQNIRQLAAATGFKYKWIESAQQFSHPAVLILFTPEGRISRYLYGVQYPPKTMRLSLVEASAGKIGSAMDQLLLVCFHYDPKAGTYTLAAVNFMRLGAALTVMILAAVFWRLYRWEKRRTATPQPPPTPHSAS